MSAVEELCTKLMQARVALAVIETCAGHIGATMRDNREMLDGIPRDERAELLPLVIDSMIQSMEAMAATARGESGQINVEAIFKQAQDKFKGGEAG